MKKKPKKPKDKIHAIDKGTVYDIPTCLSELGKAVKADQFGDVDLCMVLVRSVRGDRYRVASRVYGNAPYAEWLLLLEQAKLDRLG